LPVEECRAIEQRTKGLMKHMTDREKALTDLTGERDAAKKKIALLEESVAAKESLLSQLKERLAHTSDLLERVRQPNCFSNNSL
jgi:chromosome segregation ATPase